MKPLPKELLEQLTAALGITGAAYVRFKYVDGEIVAELLGTHKRDKRRRANQLAKAARRKQRK